MKFCAIFLFVSTIIFSQQKNDKYLNFDGIYETKCSYNSDSSKGEKSFLRFYRNKKVISVTTECDAEASDLKDWFNLNMELLSVGKYKTKIKRIQFSTISKEGAVEYRGKIKKNGILSLRTRSLINNYRDRERYKFVKIFENN